MDKFLNGKVFFENTIGALYFYYKQTKANDNKSKNTKGLLTRKASERGLF